MSAYTETRGTIERGKHEIIESDVGDVLTCVGVPALKTAERVAVPWSHITKTGAIFVLPGGPIKVSAVQGEVSYTLRQKFKPVVIEPPAPEVTPEVTPLPAPFVLLEPPAPVVDDKPQVSGWRKFMNKLAGYVRFWK